MKIYLGQENIILEADLDNEICISNVKFVLLIQAEALPTSCQILRFRGIAVEKLCYRLFRYLHK